MGEVNMFPRRPGRAPAFLDDLPEDLRNYFRVLIANSRRRIVDPMWPEPEQEQLSLPGIEPEQDDREYPTED